MSKKPDLEWPEHPRAVIKNDCIYVVFADGSKICWGHEDVDSILAVAFDIEEGLQAIQYLTDRFNHLIVDSCDELVERGYSNQKITGYLHDALRNIIEKKSLIKQRKINAGVNDIIPYYIH